MSYLTVPRLVFAGQFQADPSTVNNDPEHFDSRRFRSNYQLPGSGATNGWWNPRGTGAWRFRGCIVVRVDYRDGTSCIDASVDPIVGAAVNDADARVEGKLVDLDPEQQMVSEVWGFQVLIGQRDRGFGFRSDFRVAPFADIWVRYPQGQPDSFFGAFYQSVLEGIDWAGTGGSRFLEELVAAGVPPERLSIKFNVDGFNDDASTPSFTFGRVIGTIGLHDPTEPVHFVTGRALQTTSATSSFNTAYAQIRGNVLSLDVGNSLPTQSAGGPLVDNGPLVAALLPSGGAPVALGDIYYLEPKWYDKTAGVVSINITSDQAQQALSTPLGIIQLTSQGPQTILSEAADGGFVRADQFVFRMNPGDQQQTRFYATKFGARAANQPISLAYDPTQMQGQTQQGPVTGPKIVGQPEAAFTFSGSIVTDAQGVAPLTLHAADPGNPRVYIDGQLYGVTYGLGTTPPPVGSVQNPSQILNALVWSGYNVPKRPTWMRDVQPIFQQYSNLYPVMQPIVDLGNYASMVEKRFILKNVFNPPPTDPNYMPVTRDLSAAKRATILKWLDRPHYMCLDCVADLLVALQQAIELEHSTIPPYLCALYSIKPGVNGEVARLIRSVVIEEMLHMALVSNLLVSLGGSPQIGHPAFVPRYPGPLPGGLRGGLTVRLRRCSIAQIRDVFLSIEQPEETAEPGGGDVDLGDPIDVSQFTIGWFYDEIKRALGVLSKSGQISFGHADKQVTMWPVPDQLFAITSLEDACRAIDEIKHQGEGRSVLNPDDGDHELSHYFKFAEIVAGRRIVVDPADCIGDPQRRGFSYTGAPIPFDPDGVWPMMDDPDIALLPAGSRARVLSEQFARTYQSMLNGLHRCFNGDPGYINQAVGSMYSLDLAARQLMQTPSGRNDGTTAGPSFQLPFPE